MRITTHTPGYCQCHAPYTPHFGLPVGPGLPVPPVNWQDSPVPARTVNPAPEGVIPPSYSHIGQDRHTSSGRERRNTEACLSLALAGPRPFTLRTANAIGTLTEALVDSAPENTPSAPLPRYQTPEQRAEATVSGMLIA